MLTMKHEMNGCEFVQEIGSFVAKTREGRLSFTAYERDEFGPTAGVWGGPQIGEEGYWNATIYVMNRHGSTVGTYRYFIDPDSLTSEATGPDNSQAA